MNTAKHSFFCESIAEGFLSEDESNHAIRVLRLKDGDLITLIDGKGKWAQATITNAHKKKLLFEVIKENEVITSSHHIHIAMAPTKNMDRFSFFVEKAIEIGINEITPLLCKNSERKQLNIEKVRKHAISALKQSGNLFLPIINDLTSITDFLEQKFKHKQLFIAHCEDDENKKAFKNEITTEKKVVILIGPEGDFTPEEINLAKENEFSPVSLGESRLRTETAGIVACHTVHII